MVSRSPTPTPAVTPLTASQPSPIAAPSPTKPRPEDLLQIRGVQQLTDRIGWVVVPDGPASALWKASDAGANWTKLNVPPLTRFDQLRFIDEQNGWALAFLPSGPRSVVFKTSDGARTWQERLSIPVDLSAGVDGSVHQLQAVDAMNAWVIVQYGPCGHDGCPDQEIRATSDGGLTWRSLYRGGDSGRIPYLLRMASRDVGWTVAQKFLRGGEVVLGTKDGGRTWRELRETVGVVALDAASERDAWVLTRDGAFCTSSSCSKYELLRTADGGATWQSLGNPAEQGCGGGHLRGPLFASPQVGYFGLDLGAGGIDAPGGIMVTGDGGRTWKCSTSPRNVTTVSAADPRHAWAISFDRSSGAYSLYRTVDSGATWERFAAPPRTP